MKAASVLTTMSGLGVLSVPASAESAPTWGNDGGMFLAGPAKLVSTTARMNATGAKSIAVPADVRDGAQMQDVVEEALSHSGKSMSLSQTQGFRYTM